MKNKILAAFCGLCMLLSMAGCGGGEETTTTAMVTAVEGTVVTLREMNRDFSQRPEGERQQRPEGERQERPEGERPQDQEGFDPEQFGGTMPESFDGTMPSFDGTMPEEFEGTRPTRGDGEGERPAFQMPEGSGETVTVDLAKSHISVEIDDGKATGSMEDIKVGSFLTITKNAKGEVTNVLVSSRSGFGGMGGFRGGSRGDASSQNEEA